MNEKMIQIIPLYFIVDKYSLKVKASYLKCATAIKAFKSLDRNRYVLARAREGTICEVDEF